MCTKSYITVGIADTDMLQYNYLQSDDMKFQLLLQTYGCQLEVFCAECEKTQDSWLVSYYKEY